MCSMCHDDTVKGAADIVAVEQGLGRLNAAIGGARAILTRAEEAGMLVDEGLGVLRDAEEQQVLARLTVHAFAASAVQAPSRTRVSRRPTRAEADGPRGDGGASVPPQGPGRRHDPHPRLPRHPLGEDPAAAADQLGRFHSHHRESVHMERRSAGAVRLYQWYTSRPQNVLAVYGA